jgi:protein-disulfide isomerase
MLRLRFIDTGKVKFVYRHFPSDVIATHASQLVECAGPEKFYETIDTLFRSQVDWLTASDAEGEMTKLLQGRGLAPDANCFANDGLLDKIVNDVQSGRLLKVTFTPTLFINGRNVGNPGDADAIAKILADIDR